MNSGEYTRYERLKSNGVGQALKFRSIQKNWDAVISFLEKHTEYELPETIKLTAYGSTEFDPEGLIDCTELAVDEFGKPSETYNTTKSWEFPYSDVEKPLNFLIRGEPWQKQVLGPVSLSVSFRNIKWKNLDNDIAPWSTRLLVVFERSSYVSPLLIIPIPSDDEKFLTFLSSVKDDIPFKLNPKIFRRALPSKGKLGFRNLKPDSEIVKKITETLKK